jgi:hypothetical protein
MREEAPSDKKKKDYNTKKDVHFNKIEELLSGGKYTHSMDNALDKAHAAARKEKK